MKVNTIQNFDIERANKLIKRKVFNPTFMGNAIKTATKDSFTKVLDVAEKETKDFTKPEDAYTKSHVNANVKVVKETAKGIFNVLAKVVEALADTLGALSVSKSDDKKEKEN